MQSFLRESSASDSNPGFLIKLNMHMHKYIPPGGGTPANFG